MRGRFVVAGFGESDWVQNEARRARRREVLIPAMLEDVLVPLEFDGLHAADLVGWSGAPAHAGFEELARAVESILERPAARRASAPDGASDARVTLPPPAPDLVASETRRNWNDGLVYVWIPPENSPWAGRNGPPFRDVNFGLRCAGELR